MIDLPTPETHLKRRGFTKKDILFLREWKLTSKPYLIENTNFPVELREELKNLNAQKKELLTQLNEIRKKIKENLSKRKAFRKQYPWQKPNIIFLG